MRIDVIIEPNVSPDQFIALGRQAERYGMGAVWTPNHISVRNNLALSLTLSGQLDEAVNILTKIVNSENATPQTRQNLAVLYSLRGDLEGARRLLAQDLPAATVEKKITAYQKLRGRTPSSDKSPAQ